MKLWGFNLNWRRSRGAASENQLLQDSGADDEQLHTLASRAGLLKLKLDSLLANARKVKDAEGLNAIKRELSVLDEDAKSCVHEFELLLGRWAPTPKRRALAEQLDAVEESVELLSRFSERMPDVLLGIEWASREQEGRKAASATAAARGRWAKLEPVKQRAFELRAGMLDRSRAQAIKDMRAEIVRLAREAECPLSGSPEGVEKTIEKWFRDRGIA